MNQNVLQNGIEKLPVTTSLFQYFHEYKNRNIYSSQNKVARDIHQEKTVSTSAAK